MSAAVRKAKVVGWNPPNDLFLTCFWVFVSKLFSFISNSRVFALKLIFFSIIFFGNSLFLPRESFVFPRYWNWSFFFSFLKKLEFLFNLPEEPKKVWFFWIVQLCGQKIELFSSLLVSVLLIILFIPGPNKQIFSGRRSAAAFGSLVSILRHCHDLSKIEFQLSCSSQFSESMRSNVFSSRCQPKSFSCPRVCRRESLQIVPCIKI